MRKLHDARFTKKMSMKFKMAETTTSRAHVYTLNHDTTKQYEHQKKQKRHNVESRKSKSHTLERLFDIAIMLHAATVARMRARYGLGFFPNFRLPVLSTFLLALPIVPSSPSVFTSAPLEDDPKGKVGVGPPLLLDGVGAVIVIGTVWLCCAERDKGGRVGRSPPLLSLR